MVRLIGMIVFLSLISTASADITFEQLSKISATPEYLQGRFIQTKYLRVLDTGLISTGEFKYKKGEFLYWNTLEPIQNELVITPGKIVSKQKQQTLALEENPTSIMLSEILFSVLTAEWQQLSNYFYLSGQLNNSQWDIELTPLDAAVEKVVSHVEIRGGELLQELILHEMSGDYITIEFENYQQ